MKIQIHYKEVHPDHILNPEQSEIELMAEDKIFVKLLDYRDSWISNHGRVMSYYKNRDGEIGYPLNQHQYDAASKHYEETGDDSEGYILNIMNGDDYRPDGWEPSHMRKSIFGIGYLGCGDVLKGLQGM